jgi:chemotaxis receptor (MCP) glutamine deamidase CheD
MTMHAPSGGGRDEPRRTHRPWRETRVKYVVGVADMHIASTPGDVVVTHALGSCLGIAIHDPESQVGGILHVMLPMADLDPD